MEKIQLKVAASSNPASVAGAIVKNLNEGKEVELIGVGAGPTNQSAKAIAIARGFAGPQGLDLVCIPCFVDTMVDGEKKTALTFKIIAR
jgi:stage V sporulation protein S